MAKILIADHHHIVRLGVKIFLEQHGHVVIGEVSSGLEVLTAYREWQPDLIVLDMDLPGMDGFDILRRLKSVELQVRVIIFTAMPTEGYSIRCARLGANAYVSKTGDAFELLTAVNVVMSGYTLFPVITQSRIEGAQVNEQDLMNGLSDRELVVLKYLSRGVRVTQISKQLQLSDKTVSTYKARLLNKLGFDNIVDLIDFAKTNKIN
jgi:two-component system response regulator EvgA